MPPCTLGTSHLWNEEIIVPLQHERNGFKQPICLKNQYGSQKAKDMKNTLKGMMLICMMALATTTGLAKTHVNHHKEVRSEVRKEMHKRDDGHSNRHTDSRHHNDRTWRDNAPRRTITITEYRGRHEAPKRCTVCHHKLSRGERHKHVVQRPR